MSTEATEASAAYLEVAAARAALNHKLFGLLVREEWCGMLAVELRSKVRKDGKVTYAYREVPDFNDPARRSYHYIGCWEARRCLVRALGRSVDDAEFQAYVEAELEEELNKHKVVLRLETRHTWDGSDRVLRIHPKV